MFAEREYMPPIPAGDIILRKLTMADAQAMYEYSKDPDVARFVMWYPHRSVSDTRAYIRGVIRLYRANENASYGIALKESGDIIGTIGFANINYDHRCAEIGYSLSKEHWNKGYMTQALRAMIRYGFESLGFYRIEAVHDVRNSASGRVMQKCGMAFEGTLAGKLFSKGEHITVNIYGITLPQYRDQPR